jgi:hypothetical protein
MYIRCTEAHVGKGYTPQQGGFLLHRVVAFSTTATCNSRLLIIEMLLLMLAPWIYTRPHGGAPSCAVAGC